MTKRTRKKPILISIDEAKWKEISKRIPNMHLSTFIEHYLTNLLDLMIEKNVDAGVIYAEAIQKTLETVLEDI